MTQHVDVSAAVKAALALFSCEPNNLNDPSAGCSWSSVPWSDSPLTARLRQRLWWLQDHDYFDDRHCGEDYISGAQDAWASPPPRTLSFAADPDGTVTVVIRPFSDPNARDLTVVMAQIHETWLATDLRRGTGPNASIFSTHPHC